MHFPSSYIMVCTLSSSCFLFSFPLFFLSHSSLSFNSLYCPFVFFSLNSGNCAGHTWSHVHPSLKVMYCEEFSENYEMGTCQRRQVLSLSLAAHLYAKENQQSWEYLFDVFGHNSVAAAFLNSTWYFQLVLKTNQKGPSSLVNDISVPTSVEVLISFQAMGIVSKVMRNRRLRTGHK